VPNESHAPRLRRLRRLPTTLPLTRGYNTTTIACQMPAATTLAWLMSLKTDPP
jgi:hypothetical protein